MRCHYHPDRDAEKVCNSCRESLCDSCAIPKDNHFLCSRCIALEAAKAVADGVDWHMEEKQEKADIQKEKGRRKKRWRIGLQWGLLVIALCVIIYQLPDLMGLAGNKERPLRNGTYETNAITDECINNLWKVARILQEGDLPGPELVCPASQRPFVISYENGDVIARSPNPELYGLKEIRVSRLRPVPEVIK